MREEERDGGRGVREKERERERERGKGGEKERDREIKCFNVSSDPETLTRTHFFMSGTTCWSSPSGYYTPGRVSSGDRVLCPLTSFGGFNQPGLSSVRLFMTR